MQTATTIIAVAVFGALGSLARWGLSGLAQRWLGQGFAWGTLGVNLIGCLILGLLLQLSLTSDAISPHWRTVLAVGFCGAFTTFSAFGYETLRYLQDGAWHLALANIAANVVLGLVMVWLGMYGAKLIAGVA